MGTQRPVRWAVVLLAVVLVGCSQPPDVAGGEPAVETTVPHTGPTDDLAPSQRTSPTVPRPPTPPACEPDDVEIVAVLITPGLPPVGASFRMTNLGDAWCEVDVSGSPSVDRRMEPDVWLESGASAELLVTLDAESCDDPVPADGVEVDVNGSARVVPFAPVADEIELCGWVLHAFYPVVERLDGATADT